MTPRWSKQHRGGAYKIPAGDSFRFMPESEALAKMKHLAAGLDAAGFGHETKIAISSVMRYEWKIVDQAVQ